MPGRYSDIASRPAPLYDTRAWEIVRQRVEALLGMRGSAFVERAAEAAFKVVRRRYAHAQKVTIVVGPGARQALGLQLARRLDPFCRVHVVHALPGAMDAAARILPADLLVDSLDGPILHLSAVIDAMNRSNAPILSLDLPTGVDGETGDTAPMSITADATLALVALRLGLFTGHALACRGVVYQDDLGMPSTIYEGIVPVASRLSVRTVVRRPQLALDSHKGQAGAVLVVGGGPGMPGAARLAAESAIGSGAGLVVVATHPAHVPGFNIGAPELIVHAVDRLPLLDRAAFDAIAVGTGLGRDAWAEQVWTWAAAGPGPLVVDGDALRLLACQPLRRDDFVLTPHPGEAAALLGCAIAEIQRDRHRAARRIADQYGGVCVLKGAGTVIAGGAVCMVCDTVAPALARAGTGDVLTGLLAGLIAQGMPPWEAALAAVAVHARAGVELARGAPLSELLVGIRQRLDG